MTLANTIVCPNCGTHVEISQALLRQAELELRGQWEEEAKARQAEAAQAARDEERKKAEEQTAQFRELLRQSASQLEGMQRRELELKERTAELDRRKSIQEAELQAKLRQMATAQAEQIRAEAIGRTEIEMADLQIRIAEQDVRLQQASEAELAHRKRVRELENEKRDFDLAVQRKLDEERQQIEAASRQASAAEHELRIREKDHQIERLRQAADDLKRKIEQGPVELQGEALEIAIEERLRAAFPQDIFNPVAKGAHGADVLHVVRNSRLAECGTIIWETKNAKNWSPAWIGKLKEDQRASAANVAVLVSVVMPRDVTHFGMLEDVCICTPQCALPLAMLLRERLEQVSFARGASHARTQKTEVIFDYISSDEFRHKVGAIIEAFGRMREQIVRERRAMKKQWKERDKLLEIVMLNTVHMYGDLRGIAGESIKEIPSLELDGAAIEDLRDLDGAESALPE
jgi:hypothetical protein